MLNALYSIYECLALIKKKTAPAFAKTLTLRLYQEFFQLQKFDAVAVFPVHQIIFNQICK